MTFCLWQCFEIDSSVSQRVNRLKKNHDDGQILGMIEWSMVLVHVQFFQWVFNGFRWNWSNEGMVTIVFQ